MKQLITLLLVGFVGLSALASPPAGKNAYRFTIDLVNVVNDKVKVELLAPKVIGSTTTYFIPKIVPGTYSEDDFGQYIDNFKAFDKAGKELSVTHPTVNSWKIEGAKNLHRITYEVNDTWDEVRGGEAIFEPTGTNIEKDSNYVLNNHGFMGYFDNLQKIPYEVTVKHSPQFYGSTPLIDVNKSNTVDKFVVPTYNSIVDNPIMYCVPDTMTLKVGKTSVLVSVYSANKKVSADYLGKQLNELLQAQGKYLGGVLPVTKYAFLIYLTNDGGISGSLGALEHSYSSMYFLQEGKPEDISQTVKDVAAHEFFHILTPLNLHSEEIHYFDFIDPKMSKHLWLYEGSTEYHAHIMQEKYGLISPEEFLQVVGQKINVSRRLYNDTLPFTVMSANCLKEHKREYGNVYEKGTLISLCLDVKLRKLSGGKYGILNLVQDLSKKYGPERPFKDPELFGVIEKMTYPEIGEFMRNYVAGNKPLPLEEVFDMVGVKWEKAASDTIISSGIPQQQLTLNQETKRIKMLGVTGMNAMGRALGFKAGDELVAFNGTDVGPQNIGEVITKWRSAAKEGDPLTIKVARKDADGKEQMVDLQANLFKVTVKKDSKLSFDAQATAAQLALRKSWLEKSK
jgi:predicted metalloprotease with PDZ domain